METYILKFPVETTKRIAGGEAATETMTEVVVSRPTGADMRWLEIMEGKPGQTLGLVGRLTGLNPSEVDKIDAEDIAEIGAIIDGFLPDSLKGGRT